MQIAIAVSSALSNIFQHALHLAIFVVRRLSLWLVSAGYVLLCDRGLSAADQLFCFNFSGAT